jgi:hypothetical protein
VRASLLAMDVNENAPGLDECTAAAFIASRLDPTKDSVFISLPVAW